MRIMIDRIKKHKVLSQFTDTTCCENDICVSFDKKIDPKDYVIIKVDQYYNSLNIAKRPASVDCLIVRKCTPRGLGLTLVELKNIETSQRFTIANLKEKFETTIHDFMERKFRNVLDKDYLDIKLFFVTKQEIHKRDLGPKLETLINIEFKINGKRRMIAPKMPTPSIKKCYFK